MSTYTETKPAVPFAGLTAPTGFIAEGLLAVGDGIAELIQGLGRWRRERCTVTELSALSDHLLADLGLERADIPVLARDLTAKNRGTRF